MVATMTVSVDQNQILLPLVPMENMRQHSSGNTATLSNSPGSLWPWGGKHWYCFVNLTFVSNSKAAKDKFPLQSVLMSQKESRTG